MEIKVVWHDTTCQYFKRAVHHSQSITVDFSNTSPWNCTLRMCISIQCTWFQYFQNFETMPTWASHSTRPTFHMPSFSSLSFADIFFSTIIMILTHAERPLTHLVMSCFYLEFVFKIFQITIPTLNSQVRNTHFSRIEMFQLFLGSIRFLQKQVCSNGSFSRISSPSFGCFRYI